MRCDRVITAKFLAAFIVAAVALSLVAAKPPQIPLPPLPAGTFNIEVRGYLEGKGTAVAAPGMVTLTAQIDKDDAGGRNKVLTAGNLGVDKFGRFRGTGMYDGTSVTFEGKLEYPSSSGKLIKAARLSCLVILPGDKYARVASK